MFSDSIILLKKYEEHTYITVDISNYRRKKY